MKQLFITLTLLLASIAGMAVTFEVDGLYYEITSSSSKTVGVTKNPSKYQAAFYVIPGKVTYNGAEYSVTSIGSKAFEDCKNLTVIIISNSVTSIDSYAFSGCKGLTSVTIPNSVTSIGENAFDDCSGLKKVNISDIAAWCKISFGNCYANPLNLAKHLYVNDKEVTDLVIPNNVYSIGKFAFIGCKGLTSVTIPNSVTSIGEDAFMGCEIKKLNSDNVKYYSPWYFGEISEVEEVVLGKHVTNIGGYAFQNCSSLTSITIPNSVTNIGGFAFQDCSSLTSITIPNSVTNIGGYAFQNCSSLTSITIPNSLTEISAGAFYNCSRLTSITIPNNVTIISVGAFKKCSSLTGVTIPNSVTEIGTDAFMDCTRLTSITIPDSLTKISNAAFKNCSRLTSITIPSSVTIIGIDAFYNCTGLTSITIPKSVTVIGSDAFTGCSNLKKLYNNAVVPQLIYGSIPYNCEIHVKKGLKETYKSTDAWRDYKIIDDIPVAKLTRIMLNKEKIYCKANETSKLEIVAYEPVDAEIVNVTYSSLNPAVVMVSKDGQLLTLKNGKAIITVTAVGISGIATVNCQVIVEETVYVNYITLDKASSSLKGGETVQLTATITPSDATDKSVNWTSSNTSVAIVSNTGLVTAKGVGTAIITATANDGSGVKATCTVSISNPSVPVTSVTLNKTSLSLFTGSSSTLTATVSPANATDKNITWTSSNTSVATVNNGIVTAVASGTATITATAVGVSGVTAQCEVIVGDAVDVMVTPGYYYIVSGYDEFQKQQGVEKAWYANIATNPTWKSLNVEDLSFIWRIDKKEDGYSITNVLYNSVVVGAESVDRSSYLTMAPASDRVTYFEYIDKEKVVISDNFSNYGYHAESHLSGAGTNGSLITYNRDAEASMWVLRPVTDQKLIDKAISQSHIVENVSSAIFESKLLYNYIVENSIIDKNKPLITQADDNATRGTEGNQFLYNRKEAREGLYSALIDGIVEAYYDNSGNYQEKGGNCLDNTGKWAYFCGAWKSVVNSGAHTYDDVDFMQVDISKSPVSSFILRTAPRFNKVINAQPTHLSIYATNDTTGYYLGTDQWTYIKDLYPSVCKAAEYYSSPIIELGKEYKYLRFVIKNTIDASRFCTYAEFQLYPVSASKTSPEYVKSQALAEQMDKAYKEINTQTWSQETLNSLNSAYAKLNEIENHVVTLSPAGYATFYSSESAYTLPRGLSAQVVTGNSNNRLTYKTIADGSISGVVPKGTAVMLVGDIKSAGTFTLTPAENASSYSGTNLLYGSDNATTTSTSGNNYYYKLTYGDGDLSNIFGWYWGAADGAAFSIGANKAWLAVPKSAALRSSFAIDDVTGFEDIIADENDNVYYDLQGNPIMGKPQTTGVYIYNGKKVRITK